MEKYGAETCPKCGSADLDESKKCQPCAKSGDRLRIHSVPEQVDKQEAKPDKQEGKETKTAPDDLFS